jgi:hypothetical protein
VAVEVVVQEVDKLLQVAAKVVREAAVAKVVQEAVPAVKVEQRQELPAAKVADKENLKPKHIQPRPKPSIRVVPEVVQVQEPEQADQVVEAEAEVVDQEAEVAVQVVEAVDQVVEVESKQ